MVIVIILQRHAGVIPTHLVWCFVRRKDDVKASYCSLSLARSFLRLEHQSSHERHTRKGDVFGESED